MSSPSSRDSPSRSPRSSLSPDIKPQSDDENQTTSGSGSPKVKQVRMTRPLGRSITPNPPRPPPVSTGSGQIVRGSQSPNILRRTPNQREQQSTNRMSESNGAEGITSSLSSSKGRFPPRSLSPMSSRPNRPPPRLPDKTATSSSVSLSSSSGSPPKRFQKSNSITLVHDSKDFHDKASVSMNLSGSERNIFQNLIKKTKEEKKGRKSRSSSVKTPGLKTQNRSGIHNRKADKKRKSKGDLDVEQSPRPVSERKAVVFTFVFLFSILLF